MAKIVHELPTVDRQRMQHLNDWVVAVQLCEGWEQTDSKRLKTKRPWAHFKCPRGVESLAGRGGASARVLRMLRSNRFFAGDPIVASLFQLQGELFVSSSNDS